jgi:hypothetical protein
VDSTILYFVALLCAGACCLVASAGIVGTVWFLMRGGGAPAESTDQAYGAALPTTPPEQRRPTPRREPAAETAILPTPPPVGQIRVSEADGSRDDEMETVVANPPASPPKEMPAAAAPPPPRPPIQLPPLPANLGETPAGPEAGAADPQKKTPKSSGQTIIAFDDDDEDW